MMNDKANSKRFEFELLRQDGNGRRGQLQLARVTVQTPAFMPVGTYGTVKAMTTDEVREIGYEMILANTFHLLLRPGPDIVNQLGGLHRFMHWDGPILTDSGGFQVFSLASLRKITDEGVDFRSPLDGEAIFLSPEGAVEIQQKLGSDIIMALDECIPYPCERERARQSSERTLRWEERCKAFWQKGDSGVLFGITQGGMFPDLRRWSTERSVEIGFPGYAVGGLSVGEPNEMMFEMLEASLEGLPADCPRYMMGVGTPDDLIRAVDMGVDMFDCVIPTRNARNGKAYTWEGEINIRNSRYTADGAPLSARCACPTCRHYCRAYLRHLYLANEILSSRLLTYHNLYFYFELVKEMRAAIEEGRWERFKRG